MNQMRPFDYELIHLITMASNPAFKSHAWYRAQQLDSEPGFEGIANALVQAMRTKSEDANADRPEQSD